MGNVCGALFLAFGWCFVVVAPVSAESIFEEFTGVTPGGAPGWTEVAGQWVGLPNLSDGIYRSTYTYRKNLAVVTGFSIDWTDFMYTPVDGVDVIGGKVRVGRTLPGVAKNFAFVFNYKGPRAYNQVRFFQEAPGVVRAMVTQIGSYEGRATAVYGQGAYPGNLGAWTEYVVFFRWDPATSTNYFDIETADPSDMNFVLRLTLSMPGDCGFGGAGLRVNGAAAYFDDYRVYNGED